MPAKIQIRRATAAQWTGSEILSAGEIGFETDTGNTKIGDGSTTWANLAYQFPVQTGARSSALTGGTATLAIDNANDRVGIGTTNPTTKLDVDGTLRATGNTTVGGTLSVTGNTTLSGDLAVNAATNADITTTTSTATVFNTNATTLNIGGAATTVGIGAATGTATINNATTAIAGAATVAGTLAVTGNTTLTGDLAVNGADITTTETGTATVFNTNATTLNVGQAATTVSIGATTGTATIRNATTAIAGNATVGGTFSAGATTLSSLALTSDLPIAEGGTGASSAAAARSNLGCITTAEARTAIAGGVNNATIEIGGIFLAGSTQSTANIGATFSSAHFSYGTGGYNFDSSGNASSLGTVVTAGSYRIIGRFNALANSTSTTQNYCVLVVRIS